jgi:hypothetical protein
VFQSTNFIHNIFCARYDIGNKEKKLEGWICFFKKRERKRNWKMKLERGDEEGNWWHGVIGEGGARRFNKMNEC